LQESIGYNHDKFSTLVQRSFLEGNVIKITGIGICNNIASRIQDACICTNLHFDNGTIRFHDDNGNSYSAMVADIEAITIRKGL